MFRFIFFTAVPTSDVPVDYCIFFSFSAFAAINTVPLNARHQLLFSAASLRRVSGLRSFYIRLHLN